MNPYSLQILANEYERDLTDAARPFPAAVSSFVDRALRAVGLSRG